MSFEVFTMNFEVFTILTLVSPYLTHIYLTLLCLVSYEMQRVQW